MVAPLVFEQFIAIEESLYCQIGTVLSLENHLCKVFPDVYMTATPFKVLQFMITGISVHIDIGTRSRILKELCCSITISGRMILVNNDRI